MRRSFFYFVIIFLFIMSAGTFAQKQNNKLSEEQLKRKYPRAKIEEAQKIGKTSLESWKKKRERAIAIAKRHNLPVRVEDKNHKVIELQYFKDGRPVYFKTYNLDAAETISTDEVWQSPYNLDGNGITAAIWDGGMVRNTHQELSGRVTQQDTASKPNYHATHVAGTMIATGFQTSAQGMAYQAHLDAYDWGADLSEIFLAPVSINVSNHSYGFPGGWEYDDEQSVWYWYGDINISQTEDFKFGFYTERSDTIDDYINYFRPYHLIVAAVGNDRNDTGPGPNGGHYVWSPSDTAWVWSTTTRDPDGGSNHYDCIPGGLATAKNVLTVGAVYDINGGYTQSSDVVMTDFSSWGPTDDGRIKPDIVANGYELYSCTSVNNSSYGNLSGTSMATPNASGSIALLLQKCDNVYSGENIWASTLKGLIIHTADEAGPADGPDYQFGWGLMNTQKAVDVIDLDIQDGAGSHIAQKTYSGFQLDIPINYQGSEPLIVTICWSDPHATPPPPSLNPTTKMLVNDLDLQLIDEYQTITQPYVLDPAHPSQPATTGDNHRDNVEKVFVPTGPSGLYTARITGTLFTQDFSIIVTGGTMSDTITPPPPNSYQITWDQRLSDDSTSVGQIDLWKNGSYWKHFSVPYKFWQDEGTSWNGKLKATDSVYCTEKYNHWNENTSDVIIYRDFTITESHPDVISRLDSLSEASIKSYLLSAETYASDSVDFKDPWLIDFNDPPYGMRNRGMAAPLKTYPSPLNLTLGSDFKGVFLNQDFNIPGNPYYSVRADQEQTIPFHGEDITWYFQGWEGTDVQFEHPDQTETAVVFKQADAVAQAQYKGHLVSNTDEATAYNNGRHIIQDPRSVCSDCWYMVYEDNGNIYFTTSVDAGQTWEPEKLVSDCNWCSSYTNTSPGMTYFSTGSGEKAKGSDSKTDLLPRFGFTWVISDEYGPFAVACRYYDMWSNTWSSTDVWFLSTAPEQVHPVIASAYRYHNYEWKHEFYIIYRETDGLNLLRFEKTGGGGYMLVPLEMPLAVTTENSINPSLISDPDGDKLYFCWEEEGKIYYSNYDVQQQNGPSQPLWESPPGAEGSADFNPSITYNGNGYVDIAWQYFDGETGHKFRHQHLNALSPSGEEPVNQVGLYWENIYRPSIGAWSESSQLASTVQVGSRSVYSLYYDGLEWDFLEETNSGVHPGVNSIGSTLMSAWTDPTPGLPYPVNEQEIVPPERGAKSGNFSAEIYREQVFDLSEIPGLHLKGKASLNLGDIRIRGVAGSQPWGFVPLSDSLLNGNFQQTVPLKITADMQSLSFKYRINVWDYQKPALAPALPLLRLNLLNHSGNHLLGTLQQLNFNQITGSQFKVEDSLIVNLKPYNGKTIYLKLRSVLDILGNTGVKPALIHAKEFYELTSGERLALKKTQLAEELNQNIPESYQLYQNYPNPFNPSTTISFDLPEESRVVLEIYDITGRRIRTLAEGCYPAGSHRVVWDGRDSRGQSVASGVYAYRLRVSATGVKTGDRIITRKLLLMK